MDSLDLTAREPESRCERINVIMCVIIFVILKYNTMRIIMTKKKYDTMSQCASANLNKS